MSDPYAVAQVNKDDPSFADSHPNGMQWKDGNGRHCYVTFRRRDDVRKACCYRDENDWPDGWWLAGVSK